MHSYLQRIPILLFIFCCLSTNLVFAQATIKGAVVDSISGDRLIGANVYLEGTALGGATDRDGIYIVPNVSAGEYTMNISYIGYVAKTMMINVEEGKDQIINISLRADILEGETITVTAQLEGQARAINQQLMSNTITNVVSAERIQEIPDNNAAESVGRLPGISIKREGGEANKIVIRGLAPTYNTVTVGGTQIPATDLDDRSVDMSMITPEILAGIEVTKALTADMPADAFGGTVNFVLSDAPDEGFKVTGRFQMTHNSLREDFGLYKGTMIFSNRYFDSKFGMLLTGNIERTQRGSDQFEAEYSLIREPRPEDTPFDYLQIGTIGLDYIDEIRERIGFSLMMDYRLPNGKLKFNNFLSRLDRFTTTQSDDYNTETLTHQHRVRYVERNIGIISNTLGGEHDFYFLNLDWTFSHSLAETRHPVNTRWNIRETGAFDAAALVDVRTPDDIIAAAYNDLDKTYIYSGQLYTEESSERDIVSQLNLQIPWSITNQLAGNVKLGGKYLHKNRLRDRGRYERRYDLSNQDPALPRNHSRINDPDFNYVWTLLGRPSIYNYIGEDIDRGAFLDGRFNGLDIYRVGLDADELNYLRTHWAQDSSFRRSSVTDLDDYETTEEIAAGYLMAEINLGRYIMFMPGVRYEHTAIDMTGRQGVVQDEFDEEDDLDNPRVRDTTATNSYGNWFPMFHLRIRPVDWFDIRLAYTQTISRPRMNWMLPKRKVHGSGREIELGRPDLKPQISTNYDVFLSFYSNAIGLFTLGGYYKEIDDLILYRTNRLIVNDYEDFGFTEAYRGYTVERAENNIFETTVKGFEVEWQTHFHWLPKPFDGLLLNLNYSRIWSETNYPRTLVQQEQIPFPPFVISTVIDTFRTGRMPDQSADIANLALGYDKGPFSARLSMLYQGNTLNDVQNRDLLDGFSGDLLRWDLAVRLNLSEYFFVFWNLNNITNRSDDTYQKQSEFLTYREFYGWTMDLGVQFNL